MATTTSHNKKSSAVKRILSEARELKEPTAEFAAYPLDDNIFEWHFTLRGPSGTEFEQGFYHGRIILPSEYPFRPPDVMILTPNGRWELNKKICLTFTGFHEEMWQPAWGIRTALIGVQAFMGARAEAAVGIGSLDYPSEERKRLAKASCAWTCPVCQRANRDTLLDDGDEPRIHESLPDGLTIDTTPRTKAVVDEGQASKVQDDGGDSSSVNQTSADGTVVSFDSPQSHTARASLPSFGMDGPADTLLETLVRSRLEAAALQPSISSSQVTTPGRATPCPPAAEGDAVSADASHKGKERQRSSSPSVAHNAFGTASSSSSSSRPNINTFEPTRSAPASVHLHRPRAVYRHARHPSSAEASARRLAALDRAIATVICLLAALFLRRLLSAWS